MTSNWRLKRPKTSPSTFGEKAFQICTANEALREALRTYISVEHNWAGLYSVLETVQKANGGKIPATWATKGEIKAFNQLAKKRGCWQQCEPPATSSRYHALTNQGQGRHAVKKR
jgi:hypothetical protein